MNKRMTIEEFLAKIAEASGDEVLELVSQFQMGALLISGYSVDEFTDID